MGEDRCIAVKAMVVLPDEELSAHAVVALPATAENPHGYHRLIGGHVSFGETHEAAIRREVAEELSAELSDLTELGVVESLFSVDGRPGHEIVVVYTGRLSPGIPPEGGRLVESDGRVHPVVWRSLLDPGPLPLYPEAVAPLLRRLPRSGTNRAGQRAATVAAYQNGAAAYTAATSRLPRQTEADIAELVARLGRGAQVLELGSGPGRDALALEGAGLVVHRTDITPAFVDAMVAAGHSARVLDPRRDELGGPYDGVWAAAVLLHLSRPELAIVLDRVRRATRPGGLLHASVKEGDGAGWTRHGSVSEPRFYTYWRAPELAEVLAAAGWEVESVRRSQGQLSGEWWLTVTATAGPV